MQKQNSAPFLPASYSSRAGTLMLKLNVTLILEAHCPSCGRTELPLGENPRFGVVAVCPGCGWEHQVQFLKEGNPVSTPDVLREISAQLQDALGRMELPQDVLLSPARERREPGE